MPRRTRTRRTRPQPPTSPRRDRASAGTARSPRPPAPARRAARARRWRPTPSRCDRPRAPPQSRPPAAAPAGSRMPAARSSSSAQPTDTAVTASGNSNPADQERDHREPRALYQGARRAAPLSDRSHPPAAGEPACFPGRGVVDLDLHVLSREREVDAARPVAAVDGDPAVRQREGHRVGSARQPAQAPSGRGAGGTCRSSCSQAAGRRPGRRAGGSGRRRSHPWGGSARTCGPRSGPAQ